MTHDRREYSTFWLFFVVFHDPPTYIHARTSTHFFLDGICGGVEWDYLHCPISNSPETCTVRALSEFLSPQHDTCMRSTLEPNWPTRVHPPIVNVDADDDTKVIRRRSGSRVHEYVRRVDDAAA